MSDTETKADPVECEECEKALNSQRAEHYSKMCEECETQWYKVPYYAETGLQQFERHADEEYDRVQNAGLSDLKYAEAIANRLRALLEDWESKAGIVLSDQHTHSSEWSFFEADDA